MMISRGFRRILLGLRELLREFQGFQVELQSVIGNRRSQKCFKPLIEDFRGVPENLRGISLSFKVVSMANKKVQGTSGFSCAFQESFLTIPPYQ